MLREFQLEDTESSAWRWGKDYIWAGSRLIAIEDENGRQHIHPDHLGSTRLVTDSTGNRVSYHEYYPLGMELTPPYQDDVRMKFTGHERDSLADQNTFFDVDYMHARFYSHYFSRFLSLDPAPANPSNPQSWHPYTYVLNNPIRYMDPFGLYEYGGVPCADDRACQAQREQFERALEENKRLAGKKNNKAILATVDAFGKPGQKNGITVIFGECPEGGGGCTDPDIIYGQDASTFEATVTISGSMLGLKGDDLPNLWAAVGHEGQHLVDALGFYSTFKNGGFDRSMNPTIGQSETNAFRITNAILKGNNTVGGVRVGGVSVNIGVGVGGKSLDRSISQILQGPYYSQIRNQCLVGRFCP